MTEEELIAKARSEVRRTERASAELLDELEAALDQYPRSARLWTLRGDLIQLSDDTSRSLSEALRSYKTALACDPDFEEAREEAKHFMEVHGELSDHLVQRTRHRPRR